MHTVASVGFLFTLKYDARNHELKILYMFRATLCSSSEGQIVLKQYLVLYCFLVTVRFAGWEGIIIIIIIINVHPDTTLGK